MGLWEDNSKWVLCFQYVTKHSKYIFQVRVESRLTDGVVRGAYSYVDPTNKVIHVTYIADSDGYRVLSGNNLPTVPSAPASLVGPSPVDYTPEVSVHHLVLSHKNT